MTAVQIIQQIYYQNMRRGTRDLKLLQKKMGGCLMRETQVCVMQRVII